MDVFTASLRADTLSGRLLVAHAHHNSEADTARERHELSLAIEAFDRLEPLMLAVRARLAELQTPATEAA